MQRMRNQDIIALCRCRYSRLIVTMPKTRFFSFIKKIQVTKISGSSRMNFAVFKEFSNAVSIQGRHLPYSKAESVLA